MRKLSFLSLCFLLAIGLNACASAVRRAPAPHPLDPLDAGEIEAATEVLKAEGKLGESVWLVQLESHEPVKQGVLEWRSGQAVLRNAFAVLHDRAANHTFEAVVDLTARKLTSWKLIPHAQPMFSGDGALVPRLVRADPRFIEAMRLRGITDLKKIYLDVWSPGDVSAAEAQRAGDVRLMRAITFHRGEQSIPYGPPIEGVVATVDVTNERVLEVLDLGVVPLSKVNTDFADPKTIGKLREAPSPLVMHQPRGVSFTQDGHEIVWQNWHFRHSMHPREGLVLHTIGYEDGGRLRPILYRASLSEMWIPYADPAQTWAWRNALDEGEYGLGECANTLVRGADVPENAVMLAADAADGDSGRIAVYERDGGTLWSHAGARGKTQVRRARELVVHSISTIGNYDYGFKWIFHQDGVLEFEVDLTGIVLTKGVHTQNCGACTARPDVDGIIEPSGEERFGTLVAESMLATNHQHFISLRLDFDVDGPKNSVQELSVRAAAAGADNPSRNAFFQRRRLLRSELQAARELDSNEHRSWEVFNPSVSNALGHRSGYMLVPRGNAVPFAPVESSQRKHAGFTRHAFWVTREHRDERYAAGDYPSQSEAAAGLPRWILDDESLEDQDLVVWYTLGVTHIPRAEDFPVMPAAHAGFELVPNGFFSRNPALDVP